MLDHESIKLGFVIIGGVGCLAIVLAPEINELLDKIKRILK